MKIVSVFVFTAAMIGSWMLVHAKKPVAESVHAGIQMDLKRIIGEYVQKNRPESKNLRFHRFYTENVNANQVRAHFVYSFEDNSDSGSSAEMVLEGMAVLNKTGETPEVMTWSFDELKILGNSVNFTEPIQITAGSKDEEPATPPTSSEGKSEERHN